VSELGDTSVDEGDDDGAVGVWLGRGVGYRFGGVRV